MTEAKKRQGRFTQKYIDAYPPNVRYRRLGDSLEANSSTKFLQSRGLLMQKLLGENGNSRIGMSHALLSEFVMDIAIGPIISPYGYGVDMAAQSIECGGNQQRGVDLLIVDGKQKIMMGIDVKLQKSRSKNNRNGGAWLDNLAAPFINLTLGNWPVETRDKNVKDFKEWLMQCALPNINESGQIPGLGSLRSFAVTRIKNSLINQLERVNSNKPVTIYDLPFDRQKKIACRQKLEGLIDMFGEIEGRLK